jgi:SpoVK/Ycf46/Vps4 family AAA+-type ATPase
MSIQLSQISHDFNQLSPCSTQHISKRSWRHASPFESDLEYIQAELDWLKERCTRLYYSLTHNDITRNNRFLRNHELQDLTPKKMKNLSELSLKKEHRLRKEIDRRIAMHRHEGSFTLALDHLCDRCQLNDFHRTLLLLAIAPCFSNEFENSYFGKIMAHDRDTSLTVEVAFRFFEFDFIQRINYRTEFSSQGTLIANDLLNVELFQRYRNAKDLLQADLEIDNRTFSYLVGKDELSDEFLEFSSVQDPHSSFESVVLRAKDRERILAVVDDHDRYLSYRSKWGIDKSISYGKGSMMLFYGPPGTGKTMTAHAIAKHLGKRILNVDIPTFIAHRGAELFLPGLFREARLQNAVLFFDECEILFADRRSGNALTTLLLTELERFEGVALFATNLPKMLDEAFQRRILVRIQFPEPDLQSRSQIWRNLLPKQVPLADDVNFDLLASRFEIAGGYIKNAVLSAVADAVYSDKDDPIIQMSMLEKAARHQMEQINIGSSTTVPQVQLTHVILDEKPKQQVHNLVQAVRHLPRILCEWKVGGPQSKQGGIVGLFHGPPGTGKTLCAEAIAGELNKPLLVARSSTLLSKWVGESERNLAALFKEAQAQGAVLFIDEADSLIGQRIHTQSDHNRSMINLFLSLIERHNGLILIASNHRDVLDEALERRLTHQIVFKRPQKETRLLLWESMLDDSAPGVRALDLERLARYELSGAEIRVVIIRSATMAATFDKSLTQSLIEDEIRTLLNTQKPKSSIGFSRGKSA